MVPSEAYAHAGGPGTRLFREQGDRRMRGRQSSKKKTMKTTSQKKSNRLPRESEQSQQTASTAAKQDSRLPIDSEARKRNRTLPTPTVLQRLQASLPDVYRLAEVVGKWVWVSFSEQPAAEIRQQLAQLGFHWNRDRQAWQHPCGQFSLSSPGDPHEKYASYHPADQRAA